MFPNTRWYLIDPHKFSSELYKHKQIIEIKNNFFTEDLARYYYNLFKNRDKLSKLYFISDIRLSIDDVSVIKDNNINIVWHKIIQPDYSFLNHCYDCVFFSKIISEYLNKFNLFAKNAFSSQHSDTTTSSDNELPDVLSIMYLIKNKLSKTSIDRIKYTNIQIRHNIK